MLGKKLDTADFIKKATKINGNKYDYSKSKYTNSRDNIKIVCKVHGMFNQISANHLYGQGCPLCGRESSVRLHKKINTCFFIKTAKKIHRNKYDYSKVNYIDYYTKIIIICKKHGEFLQNAGKHLRGNGCSKCSYEKSSENQRCSNTNFIKKAKEIHGKKYDYSKIEYINVFSKIKIICGLHGEFLQTPHNHLLGTGCPTCANELLGGYSNKFFENFPDFKYKESDIYLIKFNSVSENFYKVGITTNLKKRVREFSNLYNKKIYFNKKLNLYDAFKLERKILKKFKKFKYVPINKFGGYTECFKFNNISKVKKIMEYGE